MIEELSSKRFHELAAECQEDAKRAHSDDIRDGFLDMAGQWLKLAEEHDRHVREGIAMVAYQVRLVGPDGAQTDCITEAASDEECCDVAVGMMDQGKYRKLEVWRGTLMIYRLTRPDYPPE